MIRLLPVCIVIIALAARLMPGPRTIDDSYITYRYARFILAGNGFVYNPGEQVLGTTTPLYTFLMVGLGAVSGGAQAPFPQIALLVNTLADSLTCLLLFDLGKRLGSPLGGLGAALAWSVAPFSVTFAIGGLETSLYVLLLVSAAYAHLRTWHTRAAFLAALSFLTRPDALILLSLVYLDRAIQIIHQSRQAPQGFSLRSLFNVLRAPQIRHEALAFLFPALSWIIFATLYFGSPLPHSIAAKSLAYRLSSEEGLVRLLQHYATPFLEHLTFGMGWIGVALALYPFLFLLGARRAIKVEPSIWPFLVYPWFYLAVFAWANPLIFRWYLTPPLPPYMLAILLGLEQLILDIAAQFRLRTSVRRRSPQGQVQAQPPGRGLQALLIVLIVLLPGLLSLQEWSLRPDHGLQRPAPDMAWYRLELLYRQAAETITALAPADTSTLPVLAAGDVGVLGFYTPTRILDLVGLNSPQTTQYYPLDPACYVTNYAVAPDLVLDQMPDYVVILEVYGRACLLQDERFKAAYRLHQKIPTDIYGSDGMLIFAKQTAAP